MSDRDNVLSDAQNVGIAECGWCKVTRFDLEKRKVERTIFSQQRRVITRA